MKYSVSVKINKPLEEVVSSFTNPEEYLLWMKGLVSYDIINESTVLKGRVLRLNFTSQNGRPSTMVEEVIDNSLNEVVTSYDAGNVYNRCINKFSSEGEETIYQIVTVFKFGFIRNLYMWLFKGAFKQHTLKGIREFKSYMEKEE